MDNLGQAIEALDSYDLETTKNALRFLVRARERNVIEYILPLTAHPDVAIRFFAKKALRALGVPEEKTVRPLLERIPVVDEGNGSGRGSSNENAAGKSIGEAREGDTDNDASVQSVPRRRPGFFRMRVVI